MLVKIFVKAIDHNGEGFKLLSKLFSLKTEAKIKQGTFLGPKIRKLLKDEDFKTKLSPNKLDVWNAFALLIQNFLRKHKAPNCKENVDQML